MASWLIDHLSRIIGIQNTPSGYRGFQSMKSLIKPSLLSIVVLLSGSSFAQTSFTNFIVFGDSLSDTGNINSGLPDLPPPFYQTRISNGPVGVDYIAESIGFNAMASEPGGNNYAVGGGNIVGSDREDLISQIDDYVSNAGNQADSTALYLQ
ncbi:MAG: phospholipase/lecithinase/hemolysin [Arenicella sp.]|jgi:phospholipase/lecithinase/hemolysin